MHRAVSDAFIPDTGSSSSSIDGFAASASAMPSETLLAVRQGAGEFRRTPLEADELQYLAGVVSTSSCSDRALARQRRAAYPTGSSGRDRCKPDQHVLEHAVVLEYAGALERPHQAEPGDFVRLQPVQQCPAIADFAAGRLAGSR